MKKRTTAFRRLSTGIGAVALMCAGLAAGTAAANADTFTGYPVPDQTGSLTLHKHVLDGNSTPGHPAGAPLEGVKFTVQQVGTLVNGTCVALDVTTPAGWELINTLVPYNETQVWPTGYCTIDAGTEVQTDATGTTPALSGLKGVYLVKETSPGENLIATPAAPFVVSVPMPVAGTNANNSWNYQVEAYPKNVLTTFVPSKTVGDHNDTVVPGAIVPWTISAPVPVAAFPYYELTITDHPVTGHTFVEFTSVDLNGTPLVLGTDYSVSGSTITFLPAGLNAINAIATGPSAMNATVTAKLTTQVTGAVVGELDNNAIVSMNGNTKEVPPPSTNWGKLSVLKHRAGDTSATIAGAQFAVYDKTAATCAASIAAPAVAVATGTTNASGIWEQVLWISNTQADATGPFTKAYCLVETAAPQGFILDPTPRDVTLSTAGTAVTVYQFPNTEVKGPNLPLTGAQGTLVLTLAGVGIIGVATGGMLLHRSRKMR